MGSNTRNAYNLKSGENKLEEVDESFGLIKTALLRVAALNAQVGAPLTPAQTKAIYESNPNTNVFTDDEKSKLSGLEDQLFKGIFSTLQELETAYTTADIGSFAYVDDGTTLDIYNYDSTGWVQSSPAPSMTPAQIKASYESNPDTNSYGDSDKSQVSKIHSIETSLAEHDRQFNFDTSRKNDDIDTIKTSGYYEVQATQSSPLPYNIAIGELRVGYDTANISRIIQELKDLDNAFVYRRQYANGFWSSWFDTAQTSLNKHLIDNVYTKYQIDKMIVNTYSGTTLPNPNQGKTGDKYHRYQTEVDTTYASGASAEPYNSQGFYVFDDFDSNGLYEIFIDPSLHKIYFSWKVSKPAMWYPVLEIGTTDINLNIEYSNDVMFVAVYSSGHNSLVESITTSTSFKFTAKELSGKNEDYENFDGSWFYTPIMDRTYDFTKEQKGGTSGNAQDISTTTFTDINNLITPSNRIAGVYQVTLSITYSYNSTTSSAKFRWRIGSTGLWENFITENKDKTDLKFLTYTFPYNHAGNGAIQIDLQGACEDASKTLTVEYSNIIVERKV